MIDGGDDVSSTDWMQRFRTIHPAAACRDYDPKFGPVYVRGQGARLWDTSGNTYFDLTCGYSAANFGQAFEPLVAAARRQLGQLSHLTGEPHVARIQLAEKLVQILGFPGRSTQVMFNATGARAVETAWKAATCYRPGKLLTIGPSYHGRSIATLALAPGTPSALKLMREDCTQTWPADEFPYCGVCPLGLAYPGCNLQCAQSLMQFIENHATQLSAILVEPVIGARGYIFPPDAFFRRLRSLTSKTGILLIADEIQSGLGRCGAWLLSHRQGWQPDLVVLGKSLGGGIVPISAVVGRADVLNALPIGSESETFAASPLAAAIAWEVIAQLEFGGWMERGARAGEQLRNCMSVEVQRNTGLQCVIEGVAASCVFEFASSHERGNPDLLRAAQARAWDFAKACVSQRLLVHHSGPYSTRVVLLPPLTVSDDEMTEILRLLKGAIQAIRFKPTGAETLPGR
jgi:4-aminobutyrate aminotransferase/(S)-3-amino-2-methylpropionate transaminase